MPFEFNRSIKNVSIRSQLPRPKGIPEILRRNPSPAQPLAAARQLSRRAKLGLEWRSF